MYLVIIKVRDVLFYKKNLITPSSCAYNGHKMVMEND